MIFATGDGEQIAEDSLFVQSSRGVRTGSIGRVGWWTGYLAVIAALIFWRSDILWLPPYEDQAVGLWAEADYLVANHFNYYRLRYEEPHFMDPENGARSYMISIVPTFLAVLMLALPSINAVILVGHVMTFLFGALCVIVSFELLAPLVGQWLAALTSAAILTTPLFEVQIEQVGLDIPLTAFVLLSLRALQRAELTRAALYSLLAFLMKSTGMLMTASLAIYLTAATVVLFLDGKRQLALRYLLRLPLCYGILGLQVAMISWGDTTIESRLSDAWPDVLSLTSGLQWVPDFGLLLLAAAAGIIRCLLMLTTRESQSESRFTLLSRRLFTVGHLLVAAAILVGLMIAIARYIFIPRYVTVAIPIAYLLAISPWFLTDSTRPLFRSVAFSGVLVGVITFNLANEAGDFYPAIAPLIKRKSPDMSWWHARMCAFTERSREYLDDHDSALRAVHLLESEYRAHPIFTDMPYAWYLTKPRLGYVSEKVPHVIVSRDFAGTIKEFVDKTRGSRIGTEPIFIYAPKSRTRFPEPGGIGEVVYQDDIEPPLVVYRLRVEGLPKDPQQLEEWYLEQTWQPTFLAQRALERTVYLEQSNRKKRTIQELQEAYSRTPKDSFLSPFLKSRLDSLTETSPTTKTNHGNRERIGHHGAEVTLAATTWKQDRGDAKATVDIAKVEFPPASTVSHKEQAFER